MVLLLMLLGLPWRWTEERRVFTDVVEEWGEGRMTKEGLNQGAVAVVLLVKRLVLTAEHIDLLLPQSDFTFKLSNVFYRLLAGVSILVDVNSIPFLRERNARAETLFRS